MVISFVYGSELGIGGLGAQAQNSINMLKHLNGRIQAIGPSSISGSSILDNLLVRAERFTSWMGVSKGDFQYKRDLSLGRYARDQIKVTKPSLCYAFTQVGLESLEWAKDNGVRTVLECPNGHMRNFREVYEAESDFWASKNYNGHPSPTMVERVEREYLSAHTIRVSSEWSKRSLLNGGVPSEKIRVVPQVFDLSRFSPSQQSRPTSGPLRCCFTGTLDYRKGFLYLLRAIRSIGAHHFDLHIVGATGDPDCHRLYRKESAGLRISCAPGDPLRWLQWAEVFILPTLEDGSPFAVAEAMACALPVIVTDSCGAAEWIESDQSGWIIPPRSPDALAAALSTALSCRKDLRKMGQAAYESFHKQRLQSELKVADWILGEFREFKN